MKGGLRRLGWAALALYPCPAAAMPDAAASVAMTPREAFLAAAIAAMACCGLLSFALSGRAGPRTHVALAMLVVLIGGFALLVLFGAAGQSTSFAAVAILVCLLGLFKLMSRFEARHGERGRVQRERRDADQG